MNKRKSICVLGNCVAHRLQNMLAANAALREHHALVYMPMIHERARLPNGKSELERMAQIALSCDCILTLQYKRTTRRTLLRTNASDFFRTGFRRVFS